MKYNYILDNHDNKYIKLIVNKLKNTRKRIIQKCTDPNYVKYHNYGGRGVTYDPVWNSEENFLHDVIRLPGFDPLKILSSSIELDKDLKVFDSKCYSKDTCTWVTKTNNEKVKPSRLHNYYAYSTIKDLTFRFNQKTKFANQMGISERVVISQTLRPTSKNSQIIHNGWVFWKADSEEPNVYKYSYTNEKQNIHLSSFTQQDIEKAVGLSSGTFNKLIKSSKAKKALRDNGIALMINGKIKTFISLNNASKQLGIARSYLSSSIKKSDCFVIKNSKIEVVKLPHIKGFISYNKINLHKNIIDLTK